MQEEHNIIYKIADNSDSSDYFISEPNSGYDKDRDFTSLIAWQNAREVKLFFYNKILPKLPPVEKYNLCDQMRRAAISITANISEGYGRFHYKESAQYYRISRGSLYELKDHLMSCHDLSYIDEILFQDGLHLIEKAKISLNGFINFVNSKVRKK
ncbi:MAG: four helix bundle protein [Candidatus Marinimicrobia bacterium]|nr:four helix bundle protein [Candidatus Neomarinimicrobiota bacterium]